jgi:hypothetical protein
MKFLKQVLCVATVLAASTVLAAPAVTGDYLELRTCDIMVGQCFANGDIGLRGKEAVMLWSVEEGSWDGVAVDGLRVMAMVRAQDTLGDLKYNAPKAPESIIVTDERASAEQRSALIAMAKKLGADLLSNVVLTKSSAIEANFDTKGERLASIRVGESVQVSARPFYKDDGCCGHESPYYPPLISLSNAKPAVAQRAVISDATLGCTWKSAESPNVFLGKFEV